MKTAYTTHGLLFEDKDLAIVVGNDDDVIEVMGSNYFDTIEGEIYIAPDFNKHSEIECNIILNNSKIELEDIRDNASVFFVEVGLMEGEDPMLEIKDRKFKLEHLSMGLQARIMETANKMYNDWLKVK